MEREDDIRKFFDSLDKLKVDHDTYKELTNKQISGIEIYYKDQIKELHERIVDHDSKMGMTVA